MEINNNNILCPLCQSSNTALKFKKDAIPYYNCSACGFLFSKPITNENFKEKIDDFEDAYIKYFDNNETDKKNFNFLLKWLQKKIDFNSKRVLDIGCGSGKFVFFLRENDINAQGVEYSKALFNKYLKDKDFFYNGTLEDFNKKRTGMYDVITLFDVLEHIDYPSKFIHEISNLQSSNGYLIIEIPLYGTFHSKILGKKWHFFNKYHLSYFHKKRLLKLLEEHNYSLVQEKYRGKYFHLSYVIKYFYFSFFKKEINIPTFFERFYIYLNTYDIYVACFKKK